MQTSENVFAITGAIRVMLIFYFIPWPSTSCSDTRCYFSAGPARRFCHKRCHRGDADLLSQFRGPPPYAPKPGGFFLQASEKVFAITGATGVMLICYLIPVALHLMLRNQEKRGKYIDTTGRRYLRHHKRTSTINGQKRAVIIRMSQVLSVQSRVGVKGGREGQPPA
jgi:hypothetical protein